MKKGTRLAVYLLLVIIMLVSALGCTSTTTSGTASISSTTSITSTSSTTASTTKVSTTQTSLTTKTTATTPSTTAAATRVITDMYGRELTVPAVINRVLTTGPIEMEMVYLLAPEKLVGLCFSYNGSPPLVKDEYLDIPITGGWFGTQTGNYETMIAAQPDIVLEGSETSLAERQEKFGDIPVVGLCAGDEVSNYTDDALTGWENEFRFLGELLGVPEQAESLITYYTDAMSYVNNIVSTIPDAEKIKVYYAEGKDGFSTDPVGSQHTRLIEFCGGLNVAEVTLKAGYGMAETSLEQILLWDPDMIIIGRGSQASLYETVMTDSRWGELRAVQNKYVFVRPQNPFSWFDGPPGVCQILGMYWMINTLYPEKTQDLDLNAKVKKFYSKFMHYELTDDQVSKLIANQL